MKIPNQPQAQGKEPIDSTVSTTFTHLEKVPHTDAIVEHRNSAPSSGSEDVESAFGEKKGSTADVDVMQNEANTEGLRIPPDGGTWAWLCVFAGFICQFCSFGFVNA